MQFFYNKLFNVVTIFLCLSTSAYTQIDNDKVHIDFFNGMFDLNIVDFLGTEDVKKIYNFDYQDKGIIESNIYDMLYLFDEFAEYHIILPSSVLLDSNVSSNQYGYQFVMTSGKYDSNIYNGITSIIFKI